MNPLLAIVGVLLLFPGLCGVFYFGAAFLENLMPSPGNQGYDIAFLAFAVPSIHAGCLGLWLLSRGNQGPGLRAFTRYAGWFGALASLFLLWRFQVISPSETHSTLEYLQFMGVALLLGGLPFLLGGLPAIRLPKVPPTVATPQ